ncbi:hypothetical protein BASA50_009020 [Batrachochytrium salamandrivorans]|uniref:Roadblock/LAMTOR2 domain-containing protein n=1 Tax=Batrachochytrium salamandrivorans TaxID=1357716 RepID=A0ABQ8F2L2_9FUNG|nr:hypothetical protein BASA62_000085 [Batrachochytrium salamandrivorans]KAH6561926.1 hypothetical protein BASA60_011303 [Batrachochytrium salamandrivorans]KAH6575839.1 hypothetical protein BASA60_004778 [Batrachochytrium salamandrivorans]KAH6578454.1 hypothetical protein BASA61_000212 [Batrachochytrium salamandrivorans]KAH6591019.1 hypothetical protein BASA50_009020 [Batrachochytrium salamandrivorans]
MHQPTSGFPPPESTPYSADNTGMQELAERELALLQENIQGQVGLLVLCCDDGTLLASSGNFTRDPVESAMQVYGLYSDSARILSKADKAFDAVSDPALAGTNADSLHRIVVSYTLFQIVISRHQQFITAVITNL